MTKLKDNKNKIKKWIPKCKNGSECKYHKEGICNYYHPKEYFAWSKFQEAPPASDLPIPKWD